MYVLFPSHLSWGSCSPVSSRRRRILAVADPIAAAATTAAVDANTPAHLFPGQVWALDATVGGEIPPQPKVVVILEATLGGEIDL